MNQTWENSKKPSFESDFGLFGTNLAHQLLFFFLFFFSKIWLRQSLDFMDSYYHVQYQKKTNDPLLRKTSDRRTGRWTDKRMRVIS